MESKSLTWEEMIERLHEVFDSEVVNIEEVENILASYKSRSIDWKKYAKFDKYKYTRYSFKLIKVNMNIIFKQRNWQNFTFFTKNMLVYIFN